MSRRRSRQDRQWSSDVVKPRNPVDQLLPPKRGVHYTCPGSKINSTDRTRSSGWKQGSGYIRRPSRSWSV